MIKFIDMGAIRCHFYRNYGSIDIMNRPTNQQDSIIREAANGCDDFVVDIYIGDKKTYLTYGTNAETPSKMNVNGDRIVNDIDRVFDNFEKTSFTDILPRLKSWGS
jgi:hypothetical protein